MRPHVKKFTALEIKRMCSSKAAYETQERAMASRPSASHGAYPCLVCWCWHITSNPAARVHRKMVIGSLAQPVLSRQE